MQIIKSITEKKIKEYSEIKKSFLVVKSGAMEVIVELLMMGQLPILL
jgi:hypothetical protein